MFQIGDVLKFSEESFHNYTQGEKRRMEACRKWRFLVKGINVELDRWGNKCLSMERLDRADKTRQVWSPTFFEKAEEREVLEGQP